jgi:hypothetical protein
MNIRRVEELPVKLTLFILCNMRLEYSISFISNITHFPYGIVSNL